MPPQRSLPSEADRGQTDETRICDTIHEEINGEDAIPTSNDGAFQVTLDDGDSLSPKRLSTIRKWSITIILCTATTCATCTSSIYTTTYAQLANEFAASRVILALGLSTFVLGISFGPLLTGPLSEHFGRRPVYIASWSLFVVWTIPSAVAQNMTTLIVTRFFSGFSGSSFLSVTGGTVSDIFPREELQKPMVFVALAPFMGPSLGPLLGGFINSYLHWRWTYYITLIWSSLLLLAILSIPETYHTILQEAKAKRLRTESGDDRYWAKSEKNVASPRQSIGLVLKRPFQLFFLEPMCFCLNIYAAILLGILYLFFGTLPAFFRTNYRMNLWQSGLAYLGIIIGMLIAVATNPVWIAARQRLLRNNTDENKQPGHSEPEYQLPSAVLGGVLIPIGLFWFAWTSQASIHWMVPIVGSMVFGCGLLFVFNGIFTFLVEAYPLYAASALASNNFARAFIAGGFPLLQIPMYDRLGFHWGTSVLAFMTVAMMPWPWLFFKYGKLLRGKSRFATSR